MTVISNVRWVGVSQAVKIASQLLAVLVLSRMLNPTAFGLVAMATVVTNFANLIRDMGTAAAVIERGKLDAAIISAAFWFSVLASAAVGAAVALLSPILALFFRRPDLAPLLCLVAISFPIAGSTTAQQALLERESRFAVVGRIEILSNVTGLFAAIVGAYLGMGAYSIAMQTVVTAAMSAVQLWLATGWRPGRPRQLFAGITEIWKFSGGLVGFNLINYLGRNADGMIIGRLLGAPALGVYSLAYRVMLFPVQNFTFVISRALFPVLSRRRESVDAVRDLYLRALGAIAIFTMPLMVGMLMTRDLFVEVVLGQKWATVSILLAWLAPVGLIQSLVSSTGVVFMSRGRTRLLMGLGAFGPTLQVISFLVGVRWNIEGVAACYLVANVVNAIPLAFILMKELRGKVSDLLRHLAAPAVAAASMAGFIELARYLTAPLALLAWQALAICVVIGAVAYAAAIMLLAKPAVLGLRGFLRFGNDTGSA
jgi:O-antigen/teichoic acid export membrane protein